MPDNSANHPDPDSFGFLVGDVARLMRAELDRRISEAGLGLTPGEGRALVHAARAGSVRQSVLAERMGVEAMTLSGYIDRLEGLGLVERQVDPADRRARLVVLTDAAAQALSSIRTIAASVRADLSRDMDPSDWATLLTLLKSVRQRLGGHGAPATAERSE